MVRQDYNEAISYLLLAVDAAKKRNDRVGQADYYQSIAESYFQKKNYQQTEAYLIQSEQLAKQYDLKKILRAIYLTYKNLRVVQGDYQEAIDYFDKYVEVKEALFNEEISNLIANMEARRAFERKEQQLQIAQKNLDILEHKNKANTFALVALILGLIALAALGWGIVQRKNKTILKAEEELQQAEQETHELKDTIKSKEQELTSYTLNFVHKNELITELKNAIEKLRSSISRADRPKLDALARKIEAVVRIDEDWEDFRKHFENIHPSLMQNLNENFPDLTKNEFKLISLIRLNLSSKEMSSILGISPDSVKMARYRLRKKLKLENQEDLFDFLINFDREAV